jgi:hypothetical protein
VVESAGHHLPRRASQAVADATAAFPAEIDAARPAADAVSCLVTQAS